MRFEVVPGVPAGIAVPSYAGVPITYPGGGDTLTFVRGHEDEGKTRGVGGLGQPGAPRRHDRLLCRTASAAAHADALLVARAAAATNRRRSIYDGTLPTQETIVGTLEEIADAARRARTTAARRCWSSAASSALREHLRWFDARPLFGKRILVTRPREQAAELVDLLEAMGAEAIEAPMIRIVPPEDYGAARRGVRARRRVRLDRVLQRERGRRVHRAAARRRRTICAR